MHACVRLCTHACVRACLRYMCVFYYACCSCDVLKRGSTNPLQELESDKDMEQLVQEYYEEPDEAELDEEVREGSREGPACGPGLQWERVLGQDRAGWASFQGSRRAPNVHASSRPTTKQVRELLAQYNISPEQAGASRQAEGGGTAAGAAASSSSSSSSSISQGEGQQGGGQQGEGSSSSQASGTGQQQGEEGGGDGDEEEVDPRQAAGEHLGGMDARF